VDDDGGDGIKGAQAVDVVVVGVGAAGAEDEEVAPAGEGDHPLEGGVHVPAPAHHDCPCFGCPVYWAVALSGWFGGRERGSEGAREGLLGVMNREKGRRERSKRRERGREARERERREKGRRDKGRKEEREEREGERGKEGEPSTVDGIVVCLFEEGDLSGAAGKEREQS